jgi:hypothetical protein
MTLARDKNIVKFYRFKLCDVNFMDNQIKITSRIEDRILQEEIEERKRQRFSSGVGWDEEYLFENVTVDFSKLRAVLTDQNERTPSPAASRAQQTINQGRLCERWLIDLMKMQGPTVSKDRYFELAVEKFAVSRNGFNRAWTNAVKESGNLNWSKPGRKS